MTIFLEKLEVTDLHSGRHLTCRRPTEKMVNVFYVDNFPVDVEPIGIYNYFRKYFPIYSVLLLNTKPSENIQRGWVLQEDSPKNPAPLGPLMFMGRDIHFQLMGHLFPYK